MAKTSKRTWPKMPASPTGLFWDATGHIACAKHAPLYRSDTWRNDRWRAMSVAVREALLADPNGGPALVRCECCPKPETPTDDDARGLGYMQRRGAS